MKQTKLALSAIMIVAIGLTGANFVTGSEMTEQEKINAYVDSSPIYGHVTIIHSDPQGNILAYMQTDNTITNDGKNCMADQVFGDIGSCAITNTVFNTIGLTNGQSFPFTANASAMLLADVDVNGLRPADGIATPALASGGNATGSSGDGTDIEIANTFVAGSGVTNESVDGAVLYNSGLTALLAGQIFPGGAVSLNENDTLLVTWTITLG